MVEQLCRQRGVPFAPLRIDVAAGNMQARAREARYAALANWALKSGLGAIATAHHADDQAETLLMRLSRGSGLAGLAGVRGVSVVGESEVALLRPLLGWRKAELAGIVEAAGLEAVEDPSNADMNFERVRVRRHLAAHDWLDARALAESAANLADAWRAIEWYAEIDWEEMVHPSENERGAGFTYYANVPRAIAIETIRRIVRELGGTVSRSEAACAWDRLWQGENASLGGVLAVPGIERVETVGVAMRAWRFRPEPPRRTH
jgi:tRNA(Ile)-lysidine synthase